MYMYICVYVCMYIHVRNLCMYMYVIYVCTCMYACNYACMCVINPRLHRLSRGLL